MAEHPDYHSHPAISSSQLKLLACQTPRHYWDAHVNPDPAPLVETDAMRLGTELHMLTLEPSRFRETYHLDLTPADAPRRPTARQVESLDKEPPKAGTKAREERDRIAAAAAWWSDWDRDHPIPEGSTALPAERWAQLHGMADSLMMDPVIRNILACSGVAELPIFWHDHDLGIDCRCKPDWLTDDGWVVDLKSTVSANPRRFKWQALELGYDIQAWFYLRGLELGMGIRPQGFVFAAVEKRRPFVAVPYLASKAFLEHGRGRAELAVARLLEGRRTGIWPGYLPLNQSLVTLDPPAAHDAPPADIEVELY
jgi:exodeoxyribonuclease VIII